MITRRQLLERGAGAGLLLGRSIATAAAAASTYLQPLDCGQIT
jgi:hypothetical protein